MLSRTRRAQSRFALETLESRTLLSSGTMGEAMFAFSYTSLHLRPVMTSTASPPKASAIDGAGSNKGEQ